MKKIIAIGIELAGDAVEQVGLQSNASLLDWDIVLFRPSREEFFTDSQYANYYRGKPSLDDSESVQILEANQHWSRQLRDAVAEGKTVIVFIPPPETVYVATGEKRFSGTGRNQKTTNIVTEFEVLSLAEIPKGWVSAQGREMKLNPAFNDVLSPYWSEFADSSIYNITWTESSASACIHTKTGSRPVGRIMKNEDSKGSIILLPDLPFDDPGFTAWDDEDELVWTKEGEIFSKRLVSQIVSLSANVGAASVKTPPPEWADDDGFVLPGEEELKEKLLKINDTLREISEKREAAREELAGVTEARGLLFEKGKALEFAVLNALRMLGFQAENFDDGVLEFDAVMTCLEGRLIGESEGKDNSAINITKLRQISTNIHEDLSRDEVEQPAKGVLFGNGHRLSAPPERSETFTAKCISAAASTSVALVDTVELFRVVQHMMETQDEDFAKACREAMIQASGLVSFPDTPPVESAAAAEATAEHEPVTDD
ncbi:hypothetical protein [Loktanella sp. Alg231-35]|uniref:hypothetical protein n=1 Tax=Loktanella sp. Alg231-35 TaxID=1922220 RepID=UPI000D55E327|nr:hypothetical protein [Loktanella sp. Alg231-35]